MIIELPISINYVSKWGINAALRELYQNSIDRFKETFKNLGEGLKYTMVSKYYRKGRSLLIGNRNTFLKKDTLVLGNSDKADDKRKIGQFGEGYKLALIVLLRLGYQVTIYNGYEIWLPKIAKSNNFNCDVLMIEILYSENSKLRNVDLIFAIHGITPKQFKNYQEFNLSLQRPYLCEVTSRGEILFDEHHKNKIFVEGLFVCKMVERETFYYGYNFKSEYIELDRDRNKLTSFDLSWAAADMLKELGPTFDDKILDLMETGSKDIEYYCNSWNNPEPAVRIGSKAYTNFKSQYTGFIPIGDNTDAEQIKKEYSNVRMQLIPKRIAEVIKMSPEYNNDLKSLEKKEIVFPIHILKKFINKYRKCLPDYFILKFEKIIMSKAAYWYISDEPCTDDIGLSVTNSEESEVLTDE